VIVFRHVDRRHPFLWETSDQPAGRWHAAGEGPVHYLAETADAAWAEFLRHEGITDPADLAGVSRALWAIDLPDPPATEPAISDASMTGGSSSYGTCRAEARRLRAAGAAGLIAPSAAVSGATGSGFRTDNGLRRGSRRPERVYVLALRRSPGPRRVGGVRRRAAAAGPAGASPALPGHAPAAGLGVVPT
jgi:hypothetical protein